MVALKIICVAGTNGSGKTSIIRKFTAKHLKYARANGDVLGVFPRPYARLGYAVGVSGIGDTPDQISLGIEFLTRYDGLRVIILASHSRGETREEVEEFAKKQKVVPSWVLTEKLTGKRKINAAINAKVAEIWALMPRL
jgi:GTPase SAR1 family protein